MEILPIIYYLIIVINSICFLSKRKSTIIIVISSIFIILFVMGKRYNGSAISYDLGNYALAYDNPTSIQDFGFKALCMLSKKAGLTFENFYMATTCICLIIQFSFVSRVNGNFHLFVIAYMLYFILCPIDQMRNMCAFSVFLQLFPIQRRNKTLEIIRTICIVLLSSCFHLSFILFLIPLLSIEINNKRKVSIAFLVTMLLLIILFFFSKNVSIIQDLSRYFITLFLGDTGDKYLEYTNTITKFGFFIPICIYSFLIIELKEIYDKTDSTTNTKTGFTKFFRFSIFSCCFYPLLLLNVATYRFFRDLSLIGIVYLSSQIKNLQNKNSRIKILLSVVIISLSWFAFDIIIKGYWKDYVDYFFLNEIL